LNKAFYSTACCLGHKYDHNRGIVVNNILRLIPKTGSSANVAIFMNGVVDRNFT